MKDRSKTGIRCQGKAKKGFDKRGFLADYLSRKQRDSENVIIKADFLQHCRQRKRVLKRLKQRAIVLHLNIFLVD